MSKTRSEMSETMIKPIKNIKKISCDIQADVNELTLSALNEFIIQY